jgi:hypothetical protein
VPDARCVLKMLSWNWWMPLTSFCMINLPFRAPARQRYPAWPECRQDGPPQRVRQLIASEVAA